MRRVLHGDLVGLGRCLLTQDPGSRERICQQAFRQAHQASDHVAKFGTIHPEFGDGSLAAWAARFHRPPEPGLENQDYAGCLRLILTCLERFEQQRGKI